MVRGLLSDEEWALFAPLVIEAGPLRGRPPADHRRVLDAVFWIARTGVPWRDLSESLGSPIREDVHAHGGTPEIPTKRNRRVQHSVDRALYALRNRIERFINRLKNSRRVATRHDHTASSFTGFVLLASIRLWMRFVHAA